MQDHRKVQKSADWHPCAEVNANGGAATGGARATTGEEAGLQQQHETQQFPKQGDQHEHYMSNTRQDQLPECSMLMKVDKVKKTCPAAQP